jgi:peptidoglycan/xylan/chitin deacetylase (PgdA/CDA1 family)
VGSVVLSVDAELGWGFHDLASPPERRLANARRGWSDLADLLDAFDIPATWAVVGHCCLPECDRNHADHPAEDGWFDRESGAWADRPELRFGPSLVERLLTDGVDHELASHTFSHVEFGADTTTAGLARAELDRAVEAMDHFGVRPRSLVFPRNSVGHRDVLAECGFRTYRGRAPRRANAVQKILATARGSPDPVLVKPHVDEYGLVNVPASLFLFSVEGLLRRVSVRVVGDPVVDHARAGIRAAARRDGVFHMWLHPNNITADRDLDRLRAICNAVDRHRGDIRIETLADVGSRVRETGPGGVAEGSSPVHGAADT